MDRERVMMAALPEAYDVALKRVGWHWVSVRFAKCFPCLTCTALSIDYSRAGWGYVVM